MRDFMSSLGMTRSSYVWEPSFDTDYASPHDLNGGVSEKWKPAKPGFIEPTKPETLGFVGGALHTTAGDLGTFLCHLVSPAPSATHAVALRPHVEVHQEYGHGPPGPGACWGLGIGVWSVDGQTAVWHWGENDGFQGFMIGWPSLREGIVVLTNSDHGQWASRAAVTAFAGQEHPAFEWIEN